MDQISPLETVLKQTFTRGGKTHHGLHKYYRDFGSMLVDTDVSYAEHAQEMVDWHAEHTKGSWSWEVEDRNAYDDNGKLVDVRRWIVISFDLSGDAMLSRMTWPDLMRYSEDVKRRGRSRSTS